MRGWGDGEMRHGLGRRLLPEAFVVPHPLIPSSPHPLDHGAGLREEIGQDAPMAVRRVRAVAADGEVGRLRHPGEELDQVTGARRRRSRAARSRTSARRAGADGRCRAADLRPARAACPV